MNTKKRSFDEMSTKCETKIDKKEQIKTKSIKPTKPTEYKTKLKINLHCL